MPVYSHSRLESFETCPRKYWYRYVDKPDIERVDSVEAFLGKRVHDVLEEVYKRRMTGKVMSKDDVLTLHEQWWDSKWHEGVQIVDKTFTVENYREVGRRCLGDYYDRYYPFDQDHTLRLEGNVQVSLGDEGQYQLRGFIDRLAQRDDGVYEIHDYKTSKSVPTQEQADADRQLALYQIGVEAMWDDVAQVELVWHYLQFDKDIRSRRTPEQLAEVERQCIAVIQDIESRGKDEGNFPPCESGLCDWCDYKMLCPATKHFVAVAALSPEEFKADSGVQLVNQLSELKRQKSQLKAQIGSLEGQERALQDRVIAFAQEKGLTAVVGSSHQARIKHDEQIKCPNSGSDRREEFENALRQAGVWDAVTTPSAPKLKSLWKDRHSLSESSRAALEGYFQTDETTKVTLKKLDSEDMD